MGSSSNSKSHNSESKELLSVFNLLKKSRIFNKSNCKFIKKHRDDAHKWFLKLENVFVDLGNEGDPSLSEKYKLFNISVFNTIKNHKNRNQLASAIKYLFEKNVFKHTESTQSTILEILTAGKNYGQRAKTILILKESNLLDSYIDYNFYNSNRLEIDLLETLVTYGLLDEGDITKNQNFIRMKNLMTHSRDEFHFVLSKLVASGQKNPFKSLGDSKKESLESNQNYFNALLEAFESFDGRYNILSLITSNCVTPENIELLFAVFTSRQDFSRKKDSARQVHVGCSKHVNYFFPAVLPARNFNSEYIDVDNSSDGNCLYYAYCISLMYYLRHCDDADLSAKILKKFELSQAHCLELQELLHCPHSQFSQSEILKIEELLAPKARVIASKKIVTDFQERIDESSLYAAAHYGMQHAFKVHFSENELGGYIPENNFDQENFTSSEIFKMNLDGKKVLEHMIEFVSSRKEAIQEKFNFNQRNGVDRVHVVDDFIKEATIEFFVSCNEEKLKKYEQHLSRNFVWGTEESLFALHIDIQGERKECDRQTGKIEIVYDIACIPLRIIQNGDTSAIERHCTVAEREGLVLNNIHNMHWTSYIPKKYCELSEDIQFANIPPPSELRT